MCNRVAVRYFPLDQIRKRLGVAADKEESRFHAFPGERVEHFRSRASRGPIIESQNDLLVGERQASRIGLEADLQPAGSSNPQDAADPECILGAWGGLRP